MIYTPNSASDDEIQLSNILNPLKEVHILYIHWIFIMITNNDKGMTKSIWICSTMLAY